MRDVSRHAIRMPKYLDSRGSSEILNLLTVYRCLIPLSYLMHTGHYCSSQLAAKIFTDFGIVGCANLIHDGNIYPEQFMIHIVRHHLVVASQPRSFKSQAVDWACPPTACTACWVEPFGKLYKNKRQPSYRSRTPNFRSEIISEIVKEPAMRTAPFSVNVLRIQKGKLLYH